MFDDCSTDKTILIAKETAKSFSYNLKIIKNIYNLGYGGNQKISYRYAIENNFDVVVMIHGDGQYPPEFINELIKIYDNKTIAVFGSRINNSYNALKMGMPLYKYIGNKILTKILNKIINMKLLEFHSGLRSYDVNALKKINFEANTNNFHFDTEIIIQLNDIEGKIKEINIPTKYGDEICRVNGILYAKNIIIAALKSRLQKYSLMHDERFINLHKVISQDYYMLHIKSAKDYIKKCNSINNTKLINIVSISKKNIRSDDYQVDSFNSIGEFIKEIKNYNDVILIPDLLSVIDDGDLKILRKELHENNKSLITTVTNVAFIWIRISLLFGRFNYCESGILSFKFKRLFTMNSLIKFTKKYDLELVDPEYLNIPEKIIPKNEFIITKLLYKILFNHKNKLFGYQIIFKLRSKNNIKEMLYESEKYNFT